MSEWFGSLPKEWDSTRVGWWADIFTGHPFESEYFNKSDGEKVVRIRNVVDGDSGTRYNGPTPEGYWVKDGDVLVGMDGDFHVGMWGGGKSLLNQRVACVRAQTPAEMKFIAYALPQPLEIIQDTKRSTTVKHLSINDLKNIRLPRPPAKKIKDIVEFLDDRTATTDKLIQKKELLLEILKEKKISTITDVVTKGLNPNTELVEVEDNWFDEIPAHWDTTHLMYLVENETPVYGILKPGPHVEDGVPYIGAGDVTQGRLSVSELPRTTTEIADEYQRSTMQSGELVFAIRGSYGDVSVITDELEGANLSRDAARIAPQTNVDPDWLCWGLRAKTSQQQFEVAATGSAVTGVNIRDLKRLTLPVPPYEEQKEIAAYLNDFKDDIADLEDIVDRGISLLHEERQSLINSAITGQIDVMETQTPELETST